MLQPIVIEGRNGHRIYRFTNDAIAAFLPEFVPQPRIMVAPGVPEKVVAVGLKKARLRPVLASREFGGGHRTVEIPDLEAAWISRRVAASIAIHFRH